MTRSVTVGSTEKAISTLVGKGFQRIAYRVDAADRSSLDLDDTVHVVVREVRITTIAGGDLFFSWYEESKLPEHPIRISVSETPHYTDAPDLFWMDVSDTQHWAGLLAQQILSASLFVENVSYDSGSLRSVPVGVQLGTANSRVQLSVVDVSLRGDDDSGSDYLTSTLLTIAFPPVDILNFGVFDVVQL